MSYSKDDFLLMTSPAWGKNVVINISKIKFVIQDGKECRLYFGAGEDDHLIVKGTIDDFMEIL
jgi:hypothetical protein